MIKDLTELIEAGIISDETANKILEFYQHKKDQSKNKLNIAFGILGALLVGLGIIMIVAHNWDDLSRGVKTCFAFIPLIIGQGFCGYALFKKPGNITWREASSTFLFFAIGSSISLVGQIYNMHGNLSLFLLTWMVLGLPIIYVMRSSLVSQLYLCGITYYAAETCYWSYPNHESYLYWLLLIAALPHYYSISKNNPDSNFTHYHHWLVPLSLTITLGTIAYQTEELIFVAYMSLYSLFSIIGHLDYFKNQKIRNNGYLILGALGTISILFVLSYDWYWEQLRTKNISIHQILGSVEFIATLIISIIALGLLYMEKRNKTMRDINPFEITFVLFILLFILGFVSYISVLLVNILILIIGVITIRNGSKMGHLGVLNFGLLIIMVLIGCKFVDLNLDFVTKGILFILLGVGFFITNYLMLKKRKSHESK